MGKLSVTILTNLYIIYMYNMPIYIYVGLFTIEIIGWEKCIRLSVGEAELFAHGKFDRKIKREKKPNLTFGGRIWENCPWANCLVTVRRDSGLST